jgi:hypothetical protein
MNAVTALDLLAEVALLHDLPDRGLVRGQVCTVVEVHSRDAVEVEFVDDQGRTYALLTVRTEELIQLHCRPLGQVAQSDRMVT